MDLRDRKSVLLHLLNHESGSDAAMRTLCRGSGANTLKQLEAEGQVASDGDTGWQITNQGRKEAGTYVEGIHHKKN